MAVRRSEIEGDLGISTNRARSVTGPDSSPISARSTWTVIPCPSAVAELPFRAILTDAEVSQIVLGVTVIRAVLGCGDGNGHRIC